ncbi:endonuclease V-like protein UPF0215 family [Methanomicrobium sp. W14]|uniref:endonuclease dU n=1 Tax=Methanomicrobium sp. W14 TaxID=2817839 RepID=UPI001AE70CFB|nr:DUF99 family protein [Methanomicrobium sp. W14]MBP2132806.1 endonuclease V-like protein UPF0215 family [Methanomicrobium sp. W14]
MQTAKSGIRVLGIAESFVRGAKKSVFAGVVMRKDLITDGVSLSTATIGGYDATQAVTKIYRTLKRKDIHCIFLSGCIVSWFNVINIEEVRKATDIPVICVTYEDSEGIEDKIKHYFPEDDRRIQEYKRVGGRFSARLKTGYDVFLRTSGISVEEAEWLCNEFVKDGRVPEPLKVARLTARAALKFITGEGYSI